MQQDKRRNIVPREGDVRIVHPTVHARCRFVFPIWLRRARTVTPASGYGGSVVAPNTSYTTRTTHSR
jgi:hypothetical protein